MTLPCMVSAQETLETLSCRKIRIPLHTSLIEGVPAVRSSRTQRVSCGRFAVLLIAVELDRGETAALEFVAARGEAMHEALPEPYLR